MKSFILSLRPLTNFSNPKRIIGKCINNLTDRIAYELEIHGP